MVLVLRHSIENLSTLNTLITNKYCAALPHHYLFEFICLCFYSQYNLQYTPTYLCFTLSLCLLKSDKLFVCFQAKPIGIMPGTGMALEVHVRGVEKVRDKKLDFSFLLSVPILVRQLERFSFEYQNVICFASSVLQDCLEKLAPIFRPIRKPKPIVTRTHAFPLASATCNYFEF